ncbi:MAG: penicillin-binding transpeptidase domain-containing protein, partial [Verrucomicrobiia bacterium]
PASFDFCVLETVGDGKTELISGTEAIRHRRYAPASLFKMIVAWAAIERGVADARTPFVCSDAPGGVRAELTLAQAMFFSSNDYFRALAEVVGKPDLDAYAIRAGWLTAAGADRWLPEGVSGIERGGTMRVTPQEVHAFTVEWMRGRVGSDARVRRELAAALRRPPEGGGREVYGKTGAWGGAAWMTGYGPSGKRGQKAVTVLVSYRVPNWRPARDLALKTFYERLGLPPEEEVDRRLR